MTTLLQRASEIIRAQWKSVSASNYENQMSFELGDRVFVEGNPQRVGIVEEIVTEGEANPIALGQWINAPNYMIKFPDSDRAELLSGRRIIDAEVLDDPEMAIHFE